MYSFEMYLLRSQSLLCFVHGGPINYDEYWINFMNIVHFPLLFIATPVGFGKIRITQ